MESNHNKHCVKLKYLIFIHKIYIRVFICLFTYKFKEEGNKRTMS